MHQVKGSRYASLPVDDNVPRPPVREGIPTTFPGIVYMLTYHHTDCQYIWEVWHVVWHRKEARQSRRGINSGRRSQFTRQGQYPDI